MLPWEELNSNPKINCSQDCSYLNKFLEIIWRQIKQYIPIFACALVTQKEPGNNTIDGICLSNICWQESIDYFLLGSLELNCDTSEFPIHHPHGLGYVYLLNLNQTYSQYLILFGDRDFCLSLEQKQTIETYKELLEQYLNLDWQYQQKNQELQHIKTLLHQAGHYLRNHLAEINIIAETIKLSSTTNFCQTKAEEIKNKVINLNLDLKKILKLQKLASKKDCKQVMNQDVKQIFQNSLNEFKNLINTKKLKIRYPQETILLAIDSLKLKQIFDNLLSNAIHFSPDEETIDCHWQSFQEEILISICDRGSGLSPEDIQNMFLPFYSRRKDGQGLGLAIVRKIVLDLKGNIWAENLPQGGAKISLVLPKIQNN